MYPGSLFCSIGQLVQPCTNNNSLDYYDCMLCFYICYSKSHCVLFKYIKSISDTIGIAIHILKPACQVLQNSCWDFDWGCFKSVDNFGSDLYLKCIMPLNL